MTMTYKLSQADHIGLAHRLHGAITSGAGIDPPSETIDYTFDDAYQIRRKLVDLLIADGARAHGHKIGFTSEAMQKMYGMSGPDFGQLLDTMFIPQGEPVAVGNLCDTRVEPEIAFVMAKPLEGSRVSIEDALEATDYICAAVEVIDSRVGAMRAAAVDSISDNAGAGRVVLSDQKFDPMQLDLKNIPIDITVDDESLSGMSGDVMGHPAAPLAWLAAKLTEIEGLGGTIQSGDVVITGSSTKSIAVAPGSKLDARFGPLGAIKIEFVE